MLPPSAYVVLEDYRLNRLPAAVANAEEHRVLVEAGVIRRHWLKRSVCCSLWRLGRALAAMGRRLEQRYAQQALGRA